MPGTVLSVEDGFQGAHGLAAGYFHRYVKSLSQRVGNCFLAEVTPVLSLPGEERGVGNELQAGRGLRQEQPALYEVIISDWERTSLDH